MGEKSVNYLHAHVHAFLHMYMDVQCTHMQHDLMPPHIFSIGIGEGGGGRGVGVQLHTSYACIEKHRKV